MESRIVVSHASFSVYPSYTVIVFSTLLYYTYSVVQVNAIDMRTLLNSFYESGSHMLLLLSTNQQENRPPILSGYEPDDHPTVSIPGLLILLIV